MPLEIPAFILGDATTTLSHSKDRRWQMADLPRIRTLLSYPPSMPIHGKKRLGQLCDIVVVHGGPSAPGSAAPLAEGLAADHFVLEQHQDALTIDGLVDQLRGGIEHHCESPVTLIGQSWGAWLAFIFAARHSSLFASSSS